jgi:hypothetical protein
MYSSPNQQDFTYKFFLFIACLVVENSEKISETSSACFSGLVTWNSEENHVDLDRELDTITDCAPPGEEARGGKFLLTSQIRGQEGISSFSD